MASLYRLTAANKGYSFELPCAPWGTPEIVCLCGSTKFKAEFEQVMAKYTLKGYIVLTVGFFGHQPDQAHLLDDPAVKPRVDRLHINKIDLAEEVCIINVGGYIGESTQRELEHAAKQGKRISFLEWDKAPHPWNDKNPPLKPLQNP